MVRIQKTRKNVYLRPQIARMMEEAVSREEMTFSELVDHACEMWLMDNMRERGLLKAQKRLKQEKIDAMYKVPKTHVQALSVDEYSVTEDVAWDKYMD